MSIDSGTLLKKVLKAMNKKVLVIGSIAVDHTVFTSVMPVPGMTNEANSFLRNVGGKGANQACAIKFLGGDVSFFGAIGDDEEGHLATSFLKENNLDITLKTSKEHTGVSFITINETNAENQILIVKGANMDIQEEDILALEDKIKDSSILLTQLETNIPSIILSLKLAKKYGLITIVNPAPYAKLPESVFPYIDYFIPNEHEMDQFVEGNMSYEKKAKIILNKGVKNVIITLGEKGSLLVNNEKAYKVEPFIVKAIDTTAAGDSYVGALTKYLLDGHSIEESMVFASKCSSITVTRKGAISSLARLKDL